MNKQFLMIMLAAQLQVAGKMIQAQDEDVTGTDDVVGKVVASLGNAVNAFSSGNIKDVDVDLKKVADSIYDYLGLVPLTGGE